MKKSKFRSFKIKRVQLEQLTDKLLLINLYLTQGLTLLVGLIWIWLQGRNPLTLLQLPTELTFIAWGLGLAALMLVVDLFISKVVPENSMDDGGINEMIFKNRPLWHIIIITLLVGVCEEILFRGAIQYAVGPYWTSIIFAAIHFRYLRHWIPTAWVFVSSYALGYIYIESGTLWAPILCHFAIDLISGLIISLRREK